MIRGLALAAFLSSCGPAAAQDYCGPTWQIRSDLRAVPWEEAPLIALTRSDMSDRASLEVWVNLATGTWTVLEVTDEGQACVVAVGDELDPYVQRRAGRIFLKEGSNDLR